MTSTAPSTSKLFGACVAALGEQDGASARAPRATGMLMKKIHSQLEQIREDTAEQDACRRAEAADGAPDAERDVPLAAFAEGRHQDRERRRRDHRCAEALQGAGADERRLAPGEPREERAGGEEDEAAR